MNIKTRTKSSSKDNLKHLPSDELIARILELEDRNRQLVQRVEQLEDLFRLAVTDRRNRAGDDRHSESAWQKFVSPAWPGDTVSWRIRVQRCSLFPMPGHFFALHPIEKRVQGTRCPAIG